ncbi:lipoyl protein ligase domain-containing protein [Aquibaculum sediminis]|uniref:lipoyl protein ligase domain-containing protein n=1 Tax=Aquibaculum sediminis TaxID=3231907 RepID=UPI003453AD0E
MVEGPPPLLLEERFSAAAAGLQRQEQLAEALGPERPALLLAWQAPQAMILGHSDTRLPDLPRARTTLEAAGWPVLTRRSGGSACPVEPGMLQLALARVAPPGFTIEAAYAELAGLLRAACATYGLALEIGECAAAFCPGRWDLAFEGRKLAGLSQRWQQRRGLRLVTTAASLNVSADPHRLSACVESFYSSAGAPRACPAATLHSLAQAVPEHQVTCARFLQQLANDLADGRTSLADSCSIADETCATRQEIAL